MAVTKELKAKLVDYLRDYFANNRYVEKDLLAFDLELEQSDWLLELKNDLGRIQIGTYVCRYVLPKFIDEGWLKVIGIQIEVQLDPHKCAYCFITVGDINLIDIDTNKYCGSECASKSTYYIDPYEWGIDHYRFFFYFFEKWLPKFRAVTELGSEVEQKREAYTAIRT